jgi:hypothetical protein
MKSHASRITGVFVVVAALGPVAGCSSDTGMKADGGHDGGTSPLANFASMRQLVATRCGGVGCHNDGQQPGIVDDPTLYTTLTTFVSGICGDRVLVKPGAPMESTFYLIQADLCGNGAPRMPINCVDAACTQPDQLEGIRQWIANGAPQ